MKLQYTKKQEERNLWKLYHERRENSCFDNNKRMILEGYLLEKTGFPKITNRTQLAEIFKCNRKTIYNEIKRGTVEHLQSDLSTIFEYNAEYAQNIANERNANRVRFPKIMLDTALARKLKHYIVDEKYSPYATLAELNIKGWPERNACCRKNIVQLGERRTDSRSF